VGREVFFARQSVSVLMDEYQTFPYHYLAPCEQLLMNFTVLECDAIDDKWYMGGGAQHQHTASHS